MKVHFGQIYVEPGITFPFSHHFQLHLATEITSRVVPSDVFIETYGTDWDLVFRISAKTGIDENEIKGPTVYKNDNDVEYSLFVPHSVVTRTGDIRRTALRFIFDGCCDVFRQLEIDITPIENASTTMIESICSEPRMFTE